MMDGPFTWINMIPTLKIDILDKNQTIKRVLSDEYRTVNISLSNNNINTRLYLSMFVKTVKSCKCKHVSSRASENAVP